MPAHQRIKYHVFQLTSANKSRQYALGPWALVLGAVSALASALALEWLWVLESVLVLALALEIPLWAHTLHAQLKLHDMCHPMQLLSRCPQFPLAASPCSLPQA